MEHIIRNILVLFIFISITIVESKCYSAELSSYRIRSISHSKLSIYFKKGIFHNKVITSSLGNLLGIRHSFSKVKLYERFVFDLSKNTKIYGSFNNKNKTISIDLDKTVLISNFKSVGRSHYIKNIDFFPISDKYLSIKINLKNNVAIDIFELKNPPRFILDIKKI